MLDGVSRFMTMAAYWVNRLRGNAAWISFLRSKGMTIGTRCRFLNRDLPTEPFLVRVGDHVTITNGCRLVTHDGGIWLFRDTHPGINRYGRIDIGDNCFIGLNSIILPNVTIGRNSIVAAGSVVAKDVPPDSIVGGVPARVISTTDAYLAKVLAEGLAVTPEQLRQLAAGMGQTEVMRETLIRELGWVNGRASPGQS